MALNLAGSAQVISRRRARTGVVIKRRCAYIDGRVFRRPGALDWEFMGVGKGRMLAPLPTLSGLTSGPPADLTEWG